MILRKIADETRAVLRISVGPLTRLVAVCLIASGLALTLAWYYPARRELDLAATEHAQWSVQTNIAGTAADVSHIQDDFGSANVFLASIWDTNLVSDTGKSTSVNAYVTFTPNATDVGVFPPDTLWKSDKNVTQSWIDIDAPTARVLGVKPGDSVKLSASTTHNVPLVVRNIYATADPTSCIVALAATPTLIGYTLSSDDPNQSVLSMAFIRGKTSAQVQSVYSGAWYQNLFNGAGEQSGDVGISTRADALTQASAQEAQLGLIEGIAIAAALALVALLTHEMYVFATVVGKRASSLVRMGAGPRKLARTIGIIAAVAIGPTTAVGAVVAYLVLNSGLLTPVFPPTLGGWFIGLNLSLVILCALIAWWVSLRTIRRAS